jgi:hypothetical protein
MITATVFHNVAKDETGRPENFWGYRPGQTLVKVAEVEVATEDTQAALERVYHLLNVGDDPTFGTPDPQALTYRAAKNRSLSVGDVVVLDGVAFAVADFGFEQVSVHPAQVSDVAVYGSTPLGFAPYVRPAS